MALFGIVFLVAGLLVSVGLHELGHLLPAKRFGVKVSQYFIGFGPTLWSTTRGGTEYGVKAIPLGGFVRIAGMLAPARPGTPTQRNGQITLAEEARRESAKELDPGEEHKAFWRLAAWKKLVVMFGGPAMNLLLAAVLIGVVVSGIGVSRPTTTIGAINPCVGQASADDCAGKAQSPAARADLRPGDVVTSWGGRPVSTWPELSQAISEGGTSPLSVVVNRAGQIVKVSITPVLIERPLLKDGKVVVDDAGAPVLKQVAYAGISPAFERQRESITRVAGMTADVGIATAKVILTLPTQLWNTARGLVTGADRDATGIVGIVGVADIAGNITASQVRDYSGLDRLGDLMMLLAGLNMSLFVFNLIPLLPLDGGHILGALIEGVRRQIAKSRGKPEPGAFDTARLLPLSHAVFVLLVVMTAVLVIADIVNPVS
ncbi:RIP metalloprotease [Trueperella pyogenes]|uniref:M50 family metallopeptidase n=1 Tax=Trueperella pyogenes TaxID=1661 RepID=UPI00215D386E|nr:M50 family metallopeptidase [Trueperella pyogenes]UVJ60431.1 site-2 protease family protein [Trueperella pyogenes]